MVAPKPWYHAVLNGFRKLRDRGASGDKIQSLEHLMSFSMGSASNGGTISQIPCANASNTKCCPGRGIIVCAKCLLVAYCSEKCKNQHASRHRGACSHPYMSDHWQPAWVTQGRDPTFLHPSNFVTLFRATVDFWGDVPGMDCLQLPTNEGSDHSTDLKLCFAVSGDIRNMVQTINGLPLDYAGFCDVLLNDTNPIHVNRNLVVLFILLSSGPSIEEAAEFCTHLLYSAALPAAGANYMKRCVDFIYDSSMGESDADLSFQRCLNTRGDGRIYSVQPSPAIKRLLEMVRSNYPLHTALRSMRDVTVAPDQLDTREKYYAGLKPSHRMAFERFRETGILAPFSLVTTHFTQPNRLMFNPQGIWMAQEEANPLYGWDVSAVQASGTKHGVMSEDIMGCLFFHVKDQLRDFGRRVKELHIDIHVTSFDPGILAKGISVGALPAFEDASFDRIVTGNLLDSAGVRTCLSDWGPLIDRTNKFASIILQSKSWQQSQQPAQWGPSAMKVLMDKCSKIPGLEGKMKSVFAQGLRSPALLRMFESMDAFCDSEAVFLEFLDDQDTDGIAEACDLRMRTTNRLQPRRLGIPLNAPKRQKLPELTGAEFYSLFTIGGGNLPARFLEFEAIDASESDYGTAEYDEEYISEYGE